MAKSFSLKSSSAPKKVSPTIAGVQEAKNGIEALTKKVIKNRELRLVPLEEIKAKEQVRKGIAAEGFQKSIEELAANLKKDGLLHPILLARRDPQDNKYIVFDGESRLRAFRLLGKDSIPAILTDMTYSAAVEWQLKQVAANLMRNPLTAWELGRSFDSAVKEGVTVTDLADRFGKSRAYIQNYLTIYRAPDKLQKFFSERDVKDVVTMSTLVHCWEADAKAFDKLIAPYTAENTETISRADAKRIQKTIEGRKNGTDDSSGAKTKPKSKTTKKSKSRWQLTEDCRELPDLRGLCFRAVLRQKKKEGDRFLHGTLMSNIETDTAGCVVFLYGGKAFAVKPEDIVRIEGCVSADKIVSSDDYEETVTE